MRKNIVIFLLISLLIFTSCLAYFFHATDYEVPLKNYNSKKNLNKLFSIDNESFKNLISLNLIISVVIDIVNSKNEIIASKPRPNIIWFREKALNSKFQRPIFFVNHSYNINDLFLMFKVLGLEKIDKVKISEWKITE